MADFRKWFLALSGAVLFVGTASAQPFTCNTNAGVPPIVRQQGLTELVGDVVLNCTGGQATLTGQPVPQNNIQIFLNTNVTSRLLGSTGLTEALLMIDEPQPGTGAANQQRVCVGVCSMTGQAATATSPGINYATNAANVANIFQGTYNTPNSISWLGVPIDPPGSTGNRILRITNIRANATTVLSSTLIPGQITMYISVTGNSQFAINNPQQLVAFVQSGVTFSVFGGTTTATTGVPAPLQQCVNLNSAQSTDNTSTTAMVQTLNLSFKEGFATAFKKRIFDATLNQNVPGTSYNTESGFASTGFTGGYLGTGVADSGTKLIVRFNNVPLGVVLYVSINNNSTSTSGATAQLISTDLNGANGSLPNSVVAATTTASGTPTGGVAPINLSGGSGVAVWEVNAVSPTVLETLNFSLFVSYTANPAANLPGLGAATVSGTFAPLSTVNVAATTPVPRFADSSTAQAAFTIGACTTNILFPFLTNQAGFDSGVTIANTSADTVGTATQAGPCTLTYFGNTTGGGAAPAPQKSTVINAGTQLTFTLSGGGLNAIAPTPGFQGYMIASCNFQYAHGFAFISDVGANKVSEAYLGLILDQGGLVRGYTNPAEKLMH